MKLPENYFIIKSKRKSLAIKIHNDAKVYILVPNFVERGEIAEFIRNHQDWIDKTLHNVKSSIALIKLEEDEILFLGEKIKLIPNPQIGKKIITNIEKKTIQGDVEKLKNKLFLVDYYKHISKKFIIGKAFEMASKNNFKISRVFIRDQRTKWGTCSGKGNLSFNLRLICCPEFIINYLIIHELCHTIEMNHSKNFWKTVEKYCPEYRTAEKWLKKYEKSIFNLV